MRDSNQKGCVCMCGCVCIKHQLPVTTLVRQEESPGKTDFILASRTRECVFQSLCALSITVSVRFTQILNSSTGFMNFYWKFPFYAMTLHYVSEEKYCLWHLSLLKSWRRFLFKKKYLHIYVYTILLTTQSALDYKSHLNRSFIQSCILCSSSTSTALHPQPIYSHQLTAMLAGSGWLLHDETNLIRCDCFGHKQIAAVAHSLHKEMSANTCKYYPTSHWNLKKCKLEVEGLLS